MHKFSIIVPIYNVEQYLAECLDSILQQSYTDFECVLINDGSQDKSQEIASYYCGIDNRFKLFSKENGGLSEARNYGLEKALGEYIVFIDSDDVVSSALLFSVNRAIEQGATDLVYFDHRKFFDRTLFSKDIPDDIQVRFITQTMLSQKPNFAWARVARKELYKNNIFPVGFIYEDVLTTAVLNYKAKSIGYIQHALYGYRKRVNSITTSSAERQFRLFETLDLLKKKVANENIPYEYYSTAFVNLIQSCLVSLVRINDPYTQIEYRKLIIEEYKKISIFDIFNCFSLNKFKILTLFSKNKVTLFMLSVVLRPLVLFSDRKGQ